MKKSFGFILIVILLITLTNTAFADNNKDFIIEDGVLTKYVGSDEKVIIPDNIVVIGKNSFENNSLTSVTIPGNVLLISNSAFSMCENLEAVIIEEGVKEIEAYAFFNCPKLKNIMIPQSVEEIGYRAFSYNEKFLEFIHKFKENPSHPSISPTDGTQLLSMSVLYTHIITIHGRRGSYAEKYCKLNGIKFKVII